MKVPLLPSPARWALLLLTLFGSASLLAEDLSQKLVNRPWKLAKWQQGDQLVDLSPMKQGASIFLVFNTDGKLNGKSPLNRLSGTYQLEEANKISISENLAVTRIAGTPELMKLETLFLTDLPQMTQYSLEGGDLRLSNEGGGTTLTFAEMRTIGPAKQEP
ncbi:MAG: META domain-containing protein [Verrucomicrobiota bacterium]